MNLILIILACIISFHPQSCDTITAPYPPTKENKPFLRWWWLGSAVDKDGLTYNLEEFAKAGIGGFEITPIYGVQGNEANDISFLSDKWMEMYRYLCSEADRLGLQVDMNCGTGWPFGGPEITPEIAARKMVIDIKEDTVITATTGQKVKRAAPGGEGYVLDHYDINALHRYLEKFDEAFKDAPQPDTWFNDSYEVYGADWTTELPVIFRTRYGYDITKMISDTTNPDYPRVLCDYRECLGDILRKNFLEPWIEWAHSNGARVRNQSHGSPANILDFYAMVDIPECETFGRTAFNIPGLRTDPLIRKNDGDPAALKFASSAAHITGKKYTSAESLTWLTEHFRTSLSQCKPELDQAFCAGVNHIYFHGAPYSPKGVSFPGWMFYAAINMSPTGSLWKDAPALFSYVEKCQAFLSAGEPDADFLLYVPIYDAWSRVTEKPYMMFSIHGMDKTLPNTKNTMDAILKAGYDADYISDELLMTASVDRPVIVPGCRFIPVKTAERLLQLIDEGRTVIFLDRLPEDVPGLADLQERRLRFQQIIRRLPRPVTLENALKPYTKEVFRTEYGGQMIRRRNECGGHNYFLAMLDDRHINGWVKLGSHARSAMIYDPLDGRSGKARLRQCSEGVEIFLQLEPGQSLMVKTFPEQIDAQAWNYISKIGESIVLSGEWSLNFPKSIPSIKDTFIIHGPQPWTDLDIPESKINFATARYSTSFVIPDDKAAEDWILDLGDVRESARLTVNGQDAGVIWAVPFRTGIGRFLHRGVNTIIVDVTNLPSNRIAEMERQGIKWRIFKDANINTVDGRPLDFGSWAADPSGLNGPVTLTPVHFLPDNYLR